MRKMGYRVRGCNRNYPGNGPFRGLPPWQRPGWIYEGAGSIAVTEPYTCQRFPWLPRRWWAYHSLMGDMPASIEQSKQIIEQRITVFEDQLATLRKRLSEMTVEEKKE